MIFVSESNFCYNKNVYVKKKGKIYVFYVFSVVEFFGKIRNGQPGNGGCCGLSLKVHHILIKILLSWYQNLIFAIV